MKKWNTYDKTINVINDQENVNEEHNEKPYNTHQIGKN